MGMDVYGRNPRSEAGTYFRNSVWWWHPLANYLQTTYPALTAACNLWHSNDGDGLDDAASRVLSQAIRIDLNQGKVAEYTAHRAAELAALPLVECHWCDESGVRTDKAQQTRCNVCGGKGQHADFRTEYGFDSENVTNFAHFLADCGGFVIR